MELFVIEKNLICEHISGSHAYGTNIESSDIDIRGLFCADKIKIVTPWFRIKEQNISGEDTKYYEISHFMNLLLDQNPNIVETLWIDESDIKKTSLAYSLLRENRKEFLSSKVAFTYTGYAISQLKRIKGHNKWINNPQPVDPPKQKDFVSLLQWFGKEKNLKFSLNSLKDDFRLVPYSREIYGIVELPGYKTFSENGDLSTSWSEGESKENLPFPIAIIKFNKEEYNKELDSWKAYWTWKRTAMKRDPN